MSSAILLKIPIVVKCGKVVARYFDGQQQYEYDLTGASDMVKNLSYMIEIEESACAVPADYEREMKVIRDMEGDNSIQHVNNIIAGVCTGAILAIENKTPAIDAYMCGEKESFHRLSINVGAPAQSNERKLAMDVLDTAGSGGRTEIVTELFSKWMGTKMYAGERASRSHHNPYNVQRQEDKDVWVRELIDESIVLWNTTHGGHESVVRLLLSVKHVNVNVVNKNGHTALYIACDKDHVSIVQLLLLEKNININLTKSSTRATPLFIASENGHDRIVEMLLNTKRKNVDVDVNLADEDGCTPLWVASEKGHLKIVERLLRHPKINVNLTHNDGATCLYIACQEGYDKVVRKLLNHISTYNTLPLEMELMDMINQPVARGDEQDCTPLIVASYAGHVKCVNELLSSSSLDVAWMFEDRDALGWAQADEESRGLRKTSFTTEKDINVEGRVEVVKLLQRHLGVSSSSNMMYYNIALVVASLILVVIAVVFAKTDDGKDLVFREALMVKTIETVRVPEDGDEITKLFEMGSD
jgi:ankyrin repeat protein